jgi:hypothetical protein
MAIVYINRNRLHTGTDENISVAGIFPRVYPTPNDTIINGFHSRLNSFGHSVESVWSFASMRPVIIGNLGERPGACGRPLQQHQSDRSCSRRKGVPNRLCG